MRKTINTIILSITVLLSFLMLYACEDAGSSDSGNGDSKIQNKVPGVPTGVNAIPSNAKVKVSWTAPTDTGIINGDGSVGVITKYTVYHSESTITDTSATGVTAADVGTATTTEVTGLTNNTPYFFVVSAHNATGESGISDVATATPEDLDDKVPGAPTDVNAVSGNTKVDLSWKAPADTGIINGDGTFGVITKYTVYHSESTITDTSAASVTAVDVETGTTTEITGLTNNTQYFFVVTAHNATGESVVSDLVSATPSAVLQAWQRETRGASDFSESTEGTAIATVADLKAVTADGTYHLTADIDLNNETWTSLHSLDAPFTGTLHGNGHIISNLKIYAPEATYQGLFAALSDATINNLAIGVSSIVVKAAAGGLAGNAVGRSTTLTNIAVGAMTTDSKISVDDSVKLAGGESSSSVGGVVGFLGGGTLVDALNDGLDVSAKASTEYGGARCGSVGGLVGYSSGTVTGSSSANVNAKAGDLGTAEAVGGLVGKNAAGHVTGFSSGDVTAEDGKGTEFGGLVGYSTGGTVTGSASGDVSAASKVGGLVGRSIGTVTGSASGDVSASSGLSVGGLVGLLAAPNTNNEASVTGFASGTVSAVSEGNVGGLVGYNYGGRVSGVATNWVMAGSTNTQTTIGAVVGRHDTQSFTTSYTRGYYNSDGSDHVGTINVASATKINDGETGATGERGTNGIGTGIDGIANATAANMSLLTAGTADGEWTFTAGQWPKINLPDGVTDYVDYTTSPSQPTNFVD